MAPSNYADLGKQARDVFGKGYNFGLLKLDLKTKTESGVEFSSGCTSHQDNGKVFGNLETKYKVKEHGITFTEKWNTDNVLTTEIAVQDQLAKGLKLSAEGTFSPQSGSKAAKIKTAFNHESCAINADVDIGSSGPVLTASAVLGYQGFLGGYQARVDLQNSKVTANRIALGYKAGDFILHTNVNDGQVFGGSIYHKVTPDLDAGIDLNWSTGSDETRFAIGCKLQLDNNAAVRAKVNNASQIGLGYQQKLRDGVVVHLSTLIDAKNFNQGGHKLGLALELEA